MDMHHQTPTTLTTLSGVTLSNQDFERQSSRDADLVSERQASQPVEAGLLAMTRAELQIHKEYKDSILSTVHWSLGLVLALAASLVGYNWFTSFHIADREREAFQQEMVRLVNERTADNKAAIHTEIEAFVAKTRADLESESRASVTKLAGELKRNLNEYKYDHLTLRALRYRVEGVGAGEVEAYTEMLALALSEPNESRISSILQQIDERLRQIQLLALDSDKTNLEAQLAKVSAKEGSIVQRIGDRLKELPLVDAVID